MHSHEFGKSVLCMLTSNGPLPRPFWPNSSQFANFVHFFCFLSRESMRQWRLFNNALEPDPEPQSRHNGIRIPNGELFGLGFWSGRNLGRGLSAQVFFGQGQNPGQAQSSLDPWQDPGQAQGSLDPWQNPGQDSSEGFPQRDLSEIATGGGSMAGEYRLFKIITVDRGKWQYVFEHHLDLIVLHLTLAEAMNYLEDPDEFDEFEEV